MTYTYTETYEERFLHRVRDALDAGRRVSNSSAEHESAMKSLRDAEATAQADIKVKTEAAAETLRRRTS